MIIAGIPAFNEEKSIAKVVVLAKKHVDKVIVCDDGSTDLTGDIARSLQVQVLRHAGNMGKGQALRTLFLEAQKEGSDVFVTIDGDGQSDPNEIPRLVELVQQGADVAIGARSFVDLPRVRRVGNDILNRTSAIGVSDTQSGFRAYNGHRIGELIPVEMGMGVDSEILSIAKSKGMKIVETTVSVSYLDNTPSQNTVYHGLDAFTSIIKTMSIKHALAFYGIPGLVSILIAVVFWYLTLVGFQNGTSITNTAIIAAAATMVGLILGAVGILLWVLISVVRERRVL